MIDPTTGQCSGPDPITGACCTSQPEASFQCETAQVANAESLVVETATVESATLANPEQLVVTSHHFDEPMALRLERAEDTIEWLVDRVEALLEKNAS